ncbi:MAG: hypothetical protein NZM25_11215 [Leptospiraceae bacterium]|nr:hypothetical protein [Leptospiraceae bacterium]MDW8307582.1 hypothetical protein [Leptospiraceae bacterium]
MQSIPTTPKTGFIKLPAAIILSKEGVDFFTKAGKPTKRVVGREGTPQEGLKAEGFVAPTLQKLIMNSYVDEVYLAEPALLPLRSEIISTNNLIVYAILYRKLSPTLATKIIDTPVFKEFNRKNPKYAVWDLQALALDKAQKLLEHKRDTLERIQNEMELAIKERLQAMDLEEEDKQSRIRATSKFIRWADARVWYLYLIVFNTSLRNEIERAFVEIFLQYLENTQIATHLSNLLMEFVQNAEKAHFERIIFRHNYAPREEIDRFLRNRTNRQLVIDTARKDKQFLEISWLLKANKSSYGKTYRLGVVVSNYGLISETTRSRLAAKLKTNTEGIALADFYKESSDQDRLGAGLGLLYNSYLEDLCRKKGIKYFCNIFPEPKTERTTVFVEIQF